MLLADWAQCLNGLIRIRIGVLKSMNLSSAYAALRAHFASAFGKGVERASRSEAPCAENSCRWSDTRSHNHALIIMISHVANKLTLTSDDADWKCVVEDPNTESDKGSATKYLFLQPSQIGKSHWQKEDTVPKNSSGSLLV